MRFIILCIIITCSSIGWSQEITTDRPKQTISTHVTPQESLQVESGVQLMFSENGDSSTRSLAVPSNLFRYGISEMVEVRLTHQVRSVKTKYVDQTEISTNGMVDLELGAKVALVKKEDSKTKISALSHIIFPTGSKNLTANKYGFRASALLSHEILDNLNFGYNVGFSYLGEGTGGFVHSASASTMLSDKVGVYFEAFGELVELDTPKANYDAGFTYLLKDNLQIDFSFGSGINHFMNYTAFGVSWNISSEYMRPKLDSSPELGYVSAFSRK